MLASVKLVLLIITALGLIWTFLLFGYVKPPEYIKTITTRTIIKPEQKIISPTNFPPCFVVAEIMNCIVDEEIMVKIDPRIKELASQVKFTPILQEAIVTDVNPMCFIHEIYHVQCVQALYQLYKLGLANCTQPPNLLNLPAPLQSFLTLPPSTPNYRHAPPYQYDPTYKVRIAYTILVHGAPGQLERLMRLLYHPDDIYVIHADADTPPDQFEQIQQICIKYHVHLLPTRIKVLWGSLSLMYAHLLALIYLQDKEYDFWINISGVDLPLKSHDEITDFLRPNIGLSFITYEHLGKHDPRTDNLFFECTSMVNIVGNYSVNYHPRLLHITNSTQVFGDIIPALPEIDWYKGNRGMMLSRNATMFLLFHPYARYIIERSKNIHIPDEKTFHTILVNAPEFQGLVVPNSYHFNKYTMPEVAFFQNKSIPFVFSRKWKDDDFAREFESWFVANKQTFVPYV